MFFRMAVVRRVLVVLAIGLLACLAGYVASRMLSAAEPPARARIINLDELAPVPNSPTVPEVVPDAVVVPPPTVAPPPLRPPPSSGAPALPSPPPDNDDADDDDDDADNDDDD